MNRFLCLPISKMSEQRWSNVQQQAKQLGYCRLNPTSKMIGLSAGGAWTLSEFPWEFGEKTSLFPWILLQAPPLTNTPPYSADEGRGVDVLLWTKFSFWLSEQNMISLFFSISHIRYIQIHHRGNIDWVDLVHFFSIWLHNSVNQESVILLRNISFSLSFPLIIYRLCKNLGNKSIYLFHKVKPIKL